MNESFPWAPETAARRLAAAQERASREENANYVFLKLLAERAKSQAAKAGDIDHPLSGAMISVKALFDVENETTTSATRVLANDPPAISDAPVIARLDEAGGVFVGLTNMSEFAYSGMGVNPHYGTPRNPAYPGCVPGGSTSGGAVSVALGLCDVAIGSDTGGSLRIPAAFTGITGYKPTQSSVPMDGGKPLSDSLDSFGPMARTVSECELVWQVLSATPVAASVPAPKRLVVPTNFGLSDADAAVSAGFEAVVERLRKAGLDIVERDLATIAQYERVPPWHMTSVESRAHYETHFQNAANQFDPRVHARMARSEEISAVDYRQTLNRRNDFIAAFGNELDDDILLLPTTPTLPPKIEELADDADFNHLNLLALRNPSLANVADACSIALPYQHDGRTLSVMLIAPGGQDNNLLPCAKAVEAVL